MDADTDRENRRARQVNPEKSGIRTGNPQLTAGRGKRPAGSRPAEVPRKRRPARSAAREGDR